MALSQILTNEAESWQLGDIVTRSDEQEIIMITDDAYSMLVRCIKEPDIIDGFDVPWCRVGDEEYNLTTRYSFVRAKGDSQ